MKRFRPQVNFADDKVGRFQVACKEVFDDITSRQIIDGVKLSGLSISTSTTKIAHGLGREPNGWMIVGIYGSSNVWETARDSLFLTLDCSSAVTVDLWVF